MRLCCLMIVITTLLLPCAVFASPVKVYLLAGQSNMRGAGQVAALSEVDQAPVLSARIWTGEAFETVMPGKSEPGDDGKHFGPEIGFAREMTARENAPTIYIIKYSMGGKPLDSGLHHQEWLGDPPGPDRVNFYPGVSPEDPNRGVLYKAMIHRCREALAFLEAQKIDYTLAGIVWMQGEADAKFEVAANRYAASLKRLHARILEDLNTLSCPFVYGQVLPFEPAKERFTQRGVLRLQQWQADPNSGSSKAFPQAHMVSTNGIGMSKDTVHYTAEGLLRLGERFGDEMKQALAE